MHTSLLASTLLALAWGCGGPEAAETGGAALVAGVEVTVSEQIPTVLTVSWTTTQPSVGRVEFGLGAVDERATPLETVEATEHEAVLVGLPALTDVRLRVVAEAGGEAEHTDEQTVRTGAVPASLPALTVEQGDGGAGGFTVVPVYQHQSDGSGLAVTVVVLDDQGRYVWAAEEPGGQHLALRAAVGRDGSGLVYNRFPPDPRTSVGDEVIVRTSWDGATSTEIATPGGHHDFVELPDGGFVYPRIVQHTFDDGVNLWADALMWVEPGGEPVEVWNPFVDFEGKFGLPLSDFDTADYDGTTLTHITAMAWDEAADAWYLNCGGQVRGILRVDGATGDPAWTMRWLLGYIHAQAQGDFTFDGGATPWERTHDLELTDDGIVVFVNNAPGTACSEGLELALDTDAMTATTIWSHALDPCYYNFTFGGIDRLWNGNTLITWSDAGQLDEVTPEGGIALRVGTEVGAALGYGRRYQDLQAGE